MCRPRVSIGHLARGGLLPIADRGITRPRLRAAVALPSSLRLRALDSITAALIPGCARAAPSPFAINLADDGIGILVAEIGHGLGDGFRLAGRRSVRVFFRGGALGRALAVLATGDLINGAFAAFVGGTAWNVVPAGILGRGPG